MKILAHKKNDLKFSAFLALFFCVSCAPTVRIDPPSKPIEINLNVNIEHHIKVEIAKDVKKAISNNPAIF